MKKRYVFATLMLIVTLVIIGLNISLYRSKKIIGDSNYNVISNSTLQKEHCENNVCFTDLKLIDMTDLVIFNGYIENKTTEERDYDVSFVFILDTERISYSMRFEKVKPFKKQYFEYHTNDDRLLKVDNYVLKVS